MAGLPRKYARMGFSRGWRAFKASKSRVSSKVNYMARRRRGSRSRAVGFARRSARRGGVGNSAALLQVDAMAYGAVRQYASDAIAPFTSKIPLGTLSDEIGMGLLCWGVSKYAGKGMLGSVARKGLVIENARVGEALVTGGLSTLTGTSASGSNATNGWV